MKLSKYIIDMFWIDKNAFFVYLLLFMFPCTSTAFSWGPYRGANLNVTASEKDVADLGQSGANLVRIVCARSPLVQMNAPFSIDVNAMAQLDKMISWAKKYGLKVVIDPHSFPGTNSRYTTTVNDELWRSAVFQEPIIDLWKYVANKYKNSDVVVGYDILNEPTIPDVNSKSAPGSWIFLANKIISTIREYDHDTPIILQTVAGRDGIGRYISRVKGIGYMEGISDSRLVFSPHFYFPFELTHYGIAKWQNKPRYPGFINGQYWSREYIEKSLADLIEFQRERHVPIYIGEFGVTRWTGESGNKYLEDLLAVFEKYGWSWSFHMFRPPSDKDSLNGAWDYELDFNGNPTETRMDIFREKWK